MILILYISLSSSPLNVYHQKDTLHFEQLLTQWQLDPFLLNTALLTHSDIVTPSLLPPVIFLVLCLVLILMLKED